MYLRRLAILFAAAAMLALPGNVTRAARDLSPTPVGASTMELLVFESAACNYCPLIRRHLLPLYNDTPRSKSVPMRFVDLDSVDLKSLNLRSPLRIMPTIVLMKNGTEVNRIGGYVAPNVFFRAISHMITSAGE